MRTPFLVFAGVLILIGGAITVAIGGPLPLIVGMLGAVGVGLVSMAADAADRSH